MRREQMAKLPTFSSASFKWKNRAGSASAGALGLNRFPDRGFYIRSERTKEVALFLPDGATMEANEFFDGEAAAYFVPGGHVTVRISAD
jgi:hypothetical protein